MADGTASGSDTAASSTSQTPSPDAVEQLGGDLQAQPGLAAARRRR